jgi:hypothetical protein
VSRQGESEELIRVVVDRPRASEEDEFAEGTVSHGRPEALLDELDEVAPRWRPGGEI